MAVALVLGLFAHIKIIVSTKVLAVMAIASLQGLPKVRAFHVFANPGALRHALAPSNANVV